MSENIEKIKEYSVTELAEKYNVHRRIVLGWIGANKFPNAHKFHPPVGLTYWLVPETDLNNFTKPEGRGRPLSDNPSEEALRKRKQRKEKSL